MFTTLCLIAALQASQPATAQPLAPKNPPSAPPTKRTAWDRLNADDRKLITDYAAACRKGPCPGIWSFANQLEWQKLYDAPGKVITPRQDALSTRDAPRFVNVLTGDSWPNVEAFLKHLQPAYIESQCAALTASSPGSSLALQVSVQQVLPGEGLRVEYFTRSKVDDSPTVAGDFLLRGHPANETAVDGSKLGHMLITFDGRYSYSSVAGVRTIQTAKYIKPVSIEFAPPSPSQFTAVTPQEVAQALLDAGRSELPMWTVVKTRNSWEWLTKPQKITFAP